MRQGPYTLPLAIGLTLATTTLSAQSAGPDSDASDLAKKLQNPFSDLISVPIESNLGDPYGFCRSVTGWFWGAGPGVIFPSATDDSLGSGKWSAGPTGAVVRQQGPWTVFALVGPKET